MLIPALPSAGVLPALDLPIRMRPPRRPSVDPRRRFVRALVFLTGPPGVLLLSSALGPVILALAWPYLAYLDGQAVARFRPLPRSLRDAWQPLYPGVNLAQVRYAEEIDTVHGKGITVGRRIYFP